MEKVKNFLSAPAENKDDFWESDALIWVDWGDFDDLLSNISMMSFLMKIKFSLSAWK